MLEEQAQKLEKYLKLTIDDQIKYSIYTPMEETIRNRRLGTLETMHTYALHYADMVCGILHEALKSGDPFEIKQDVERCIELLSLIRLKDT